MALLSLWVIALYPAIGESYADILEDMPASLSIFIGDVVDIGSPAGYLSTEMFAFLVPLIFLMLTLGFGSSAISREEEQGTLDLLLSNPIARWRVVLEKFLALIVISLLLGLALWLGLAIGAAMVGVDISYVRMAEATFSGVLLGLAYGALALALTCATGKRFIAVGVAGALAVAGFLLDGFASLVDWLEPYRVLSPFHYYSGAEPLVNGLDPVHAAVLAGLTLLLAAIALFTFERRDLAV
jgi:ABC-2 type transport system permease protein